MKKKLLSITLALLLLFAALFVAAGFQKRTDVYLVDYTVPEDNMLELRTALTGSMGYIRAIDVTFVDGRLCASFYTAFGGLNSSIGAKDSFTVEIPPNCREILFDRGDGVYALVLVRENDGTWTFPPKG